MQTKNPRSPLLTTIGVLGIVGVLFSLWLVYHHVEVNGGFLVGHSACHISAQLDCDSVARSSYSEFLGIPVASFALLFYLTIVGIVSFTAEREGSSSTAGGVVLILSSLALVPTILLLVVSVLKIGTLCPFCLVLDLVNIAIFGAALLIVWRSTVGIGVALTAGFVAILDFTTAPIRLNAPQGDRQLSALSWFTLLFLALTLYFLPSFLILEHFVPRAQLRAAAQSNAVIDSFVEQQRQEIPVIAVGSPLSRDYIKGNPSGSIELVEFSDFGCPFCKRIASWVDDYLSRNPQVKFVLKHYPLDSSCNRAIPGGGHPFSCRAARMAQCAAIEGETAYWQVVTALFSAEELSDEVLTALPKELGLDEVQLSACMKTEESIKKIQEDIDLGIKYGLRGTPSFFINGRLVPSPNPELLEKIISRLSTSQSSAAASTEE